MKPKDYVFCALDFSDLDETLNFANKIYKDIGGLKVGLELFVKYGIEGVLKIQKFGIPIFLDLKFNDIPNTVKKSVENVLKIEPDLMTIHLTGGSKMINEVCKIKGNTKIIGVSLLTSLDQNDLDNFGLKIPQSQFVHNLSVMGVSSGIDGLVCSPLEVQNLRTKFGNKLIYVTPGIRFNKDNKNDQKRISSPGSAVLSGSSLLVIGRPITESSNPTKIVKKIIKDISEKI